jgi:hypothetical protein
LEDKSKKDIGLTIFREILEGELKPFNVEIERGYHYKKKLSLTLGVRHHQKTNRAFCTCGKCKELYREGVSKAYAFETPSYVHIFAKLVKIL